MTPEIDLIALREIAQKATPGPWHVILYDAGDVDWKNGGPSVVASEELDCAIVHTEGFVQRNWRSARGDKEIHANAKLIALAPTMAAAIAALTAERDRLRADERYAALGRACEANGLGWFDDAGEMWFQPPAEMIAEEAVARAALNQQETGRA